MKTDRFDVRKGDSYKHHMSILSCLFFCAVAAVQSDVSNCLHPNEQLILQSSSSEESCLLTQEKMIHKEITESHNSRGCEGPPGITESSPLQSRPLPASCRGRCPGGPWISPKMKNPQPPWAACSSAPSPSLWRIFFTYWCRTSCASVHGCFPLFWPRRLLKRGWPCLLGSHS